MSRQRGTTTPAYRSYGRKGCREGCDRPHAARGYCAGCYAIRYHARQLRPLVDELADAGQAEPEWFLPGR